jgi:hypothetical protein
MNKKIILLLAILCVLSKDIYAGNPVKVQQFINHKDWSFVENKGQIATPNSEKGENGFDLHPEIKFYGHQGGVYLYCKPGMISFVFTKAESSEKISEATGMASRGLECKSPKPSTITSDNANLVFIGSNPNAQIIASEVQEYYENFYLAHTSQGITNVHTYKTITYKNIYPKIDLVLHAAPSSAKAMAGNGGMKYEFVVYPGGKVSDIRMQWHGLQKMEMTMNGGIKYSLELGNIKEECPFSYTSDDKLVLSKFSKKNHTVLFEVGSYNRSKILVIDPYLSWGTYFGGHSSDWGAGLKTDTVGNVYMVGVTYSSSGIATKGTYQDSLASIGITDAFLVKFDSTGARKWATYYGGSSTEGFFSVSLDNTGSLYCLGSTASTSGMVTSGAFQTSYGGGNEDGLFVKFDINGLRKWATYFGGSGDEKSSIIVTTGKGICYLSGYTTSSTGITTSGTYQSSFGGVRDAFLMKFDSSGTRLWGTYFGGSGDDYLFDLKMDNAENLYICGTTASKSGIATSGTYQTSFGGSGSYNAYFGKFDAKGTLLWASYYGYDVENGFGIAPDQFGNIYLLGQTFSSASIVTSGAYQTSFGGTSDNFLAKFASNGSKRLWSTYYGGKNADIPYCILLNINGFPCISGSTLSSTEITTSDGYLSNFNSGGGYNCYFSIFDTSGKHLRYGTYTGYGYAQAWITTDRFGSIYMTSQTDSFYRIPTKGCYQSVFGGQGDAFLIKFNTKLFKDDAGISLIKAPLSRICEGKYFVSVKIKDYGLADLKSATINWSVNNINQPSYTWKGDLKPDSFSGSVNAGNYYFYAGKIYKIKVWTTSPNGVADSLPYNDTAYAVISKVDTLPDAYTGKNTNICLGQSVGIGGKSIKNHSCSWISYPVGFKSANAAGTVYPSDTTIYILTETNNLTGCQKTDSIKINVNPLPKAIVGPSKALCSGDSVVIGIKPTTGDIYKWTSNTTGFTSNISNPKIAPDSTKYFILTETIAATGCWKSDSVRIIVNELPKINPGKSGTICLGDSFQIGSAPINGITYSWTSHSQVFSSSRAEPFVSPGKTSYYLLSEKVDSSACSNMDSVLVRVNPLPNANTGINRAICKGRITQIGDSAISGNTYTWNSLPAGFSSNISNPLVSPVITTSYLLREKINLTGCNKTNTVKIVVNSLPAVNIGASRHICLGQNLEAGAAGLPDCIYQWASRPLEFSSSLPDTTLSPKITTVYFLTVKDTVTGCVNEDSMIIAVDSLIAANVGKPASVCIGDSIRLGDSAVSGHGYSWISDPSGFSSSLPNPFVVPSKTTAFVLTESITASGCQKSDTVIITVLSKLKAKIFSRYNSVCQDDTFQFTDSSSGAAKYFWYFGDGDTSLKQNPVHIYKIPGLKKIILTIESSYGCRDTNSKIIMVNALPEASWFINYFGPKTYLHAIDSSLSNTSYHWDFGDGVKDSISGHLAKHLYQKNKSYLVKLKVTNTSACSNELDSIVSVRISEIENHFSDLFTLTIFPNPFSTTTTIQYHLTNTSQVKIELCDITGKQVALINNERQHVGDYKADINAEKYYLNPGVYLLKFLVNDEMISRQLVKF